MNIPFLLSEEKSLFQELWTYITDKYFNPDRVYLENIDAGTSKLISLRLIIVGITVGFCIAAIMTVVDKKHLGGLVRKMISEECIGKDKSMTLYELGYGKDPTVRGSVKNGSVLKRWVHCVEEEEYILEMQKKREEYEADASNDKPRFKEIPFKRDPDKHHFYIDEEQRYAAEVKFDAKGANWVSVVLVILISIVICAFLCYIVPDMLTMLDNFISGFRNTDGNVIKK